MVAPGEDTLYPPFDPELLADLHADALPPEFAERLRAATESDPDAQRTLAALDAVRAELGALRTLDTPAPPIPPDVLARIESAVAEAPPPAVALSARRRRNPVRLAAAAAAALVVLAGAGVGIAHLRTGSPEPAAPLLAQPSSAPPDGAGVELGDALQPTVALSVLGHSALGPLDNRRSREDCLLANGIDPTRPLLGSGPVRLRGAAGILMLFAGPRPPQITALVVGTGCTASDPATLARADIG
ncbi:hypothetical protein FK531_00830 [Rhodococcus spelaei]|uniref:Anti-sigma-M factor RsmA n=1 Tax=Rhodococcus spelaei TaxID=2546320 RepID=A0A541BQT0_9NOCA|nr:hypothetical protein [Rhodococcus spelaei]TQF74681.1 hypothetical protein FK531_00830 [Rhodococcus spelaei]